MADEWHKSGSRLKLGFMKGADGTQQFFGWSDSQRGGEGCMPATIAFVGGFASPNCTGTELALVAKGTPAPKYGYKAETLAIGDSR